MRALLPPAVLQSAYRRNALQAGGWPRAAAMGTARGGRLLLAVQEAKHRLCLPPALAPGWLINLPEIHPGGSPASRPRGCVSGYRHPPDAVGEGDPGVVPQPALPSPRDGWPGDAVQVGERLALSQCLEPVPAPAGPALSCAPRVLQHQPCHPPGLGMSLGKPLRKTPLALGCCSVLPLPSVMPPGWMWRSRRSHLPRSRVDWGWQERPQPLVTPPTLVSPMNALSVINPPSFCRG